MYKKEETLLFNNALKRIYFDDKDFVLQLTVNGKCDLKCKYCYISNHGKELFPPEMHKDDKQILDNIDYLLNWMNDKNYIPKTLSLFSGELFSQEIGWEVLEKSINFYEKNKNLGNIVIPSNMNFAHDDKKVRLFNSLHNRALSNNISVHLSASIDGLYCESNRVGKPRDYDKIFNFCKKYGVKFHPMIYCDEIENWPKNFLWFQEMFKKYDIPWDSLYLLEVRNVEWTIEKIAKYQDFISFVVEWTYNKVVNELKLDFWDTIKTNKLFNLFNLFFTFGNGLSCSIQSQLHVRCADLGIFPCHRLGYKYFKLGGFDKETNEIIGINPTLLIAIHSSDFRSYPYCQNCMIKELCTGQCLGSMFETTGDMFTPIPSVCMLEHAKIKAILSTLKRLNVLNTIIPKIAKEKRKTISMILED